MNPLFDHIRALIEKNGPMPIARYMELALQHPDYGYYKKGDPLGRSGDFITAPEVSQMFGELIGLCCAEAWKAMGRPEKFALLELGPGRGTLMQDALRATAKITGFHAAMNLCLVESSETLRAMQMEKLALYRPVYISELISGDAQPGAIAGLLPLPTLIIANEFFDALPIRQFEKTEEGWRERLVAVDGDEFTFALSPPDPSFLLLIPPDRREAPNGGVHEVSLAALSIMRQLAQHVAAYGGGALIVDYGYAAPPGKGTLQAVSGHRHADVLERPGEVDLTAHVDFMALKHVALSQGGSSLEEENHSEDVGHAPPPDLPRKGGGASLSVSGPAGQGEFLQTLGIEMRAMQLKHNASPEQAAAIDAAVRRLTDAGEMGSLFKAMAVVAKPLGPLAGF